MAWACPDDPGPPLSDQELRRKLDAINSATNLPRRSRPVPPSFPPNTSGITRVRAIQRYIDSFEYNHTDTNFFEITGVRKNTSLTRLLELAHRIMQEAVPIKCVEATYIGLALTHTMHDIVRVPLIFYSSIDGHRYGHIVLCVRVEGKFGAIGLSRRGNLMYKEPKYESVFDLLLEFKTSYARWGRTIVRIKLGPALPHEGDTMVGAVVDWNKFQINVTEDKWQEVRTEATKYVRGCMRRPSLAAAPRPRPHGSVVATVHELKRQRQLRQAKDDGSATSDTETTTTTITTTASTSRRPPPSSAPGGGGSSAWTATRRKKPAKASVSKALVFGGAVGDSGGGGGGRSVGDGKSKGSSESGASAADTGRSSCSSSSSEDNDDEVDEMVSPQKGVRDASGAAPKPTYLGV